MADHAGRALNRREAVRGAAAFTAPFALVVGGSLATLALTGGGGPAPVAAGPRPTVTATVVQRVPYPEPSTPRATRTVEAADAPGRATPGTVRAQETPAAGGTGRPGGGRPAPSPHPSPAPSSCPRGMLTVRLPLGALPECAITIGGNP